MAQNGKNRSHDDYTVDAHPSDIDRAVFMGDVRIDNLHSAFMALATELWSVRRRQKIVEALLCSRGAITSQMIETYVPTADQEHAWRVERDLFVRAIYDPLLRRDGIDYHRSLISGPEPRS